MQKRPTLQDANVINEIVQSITTYLYNENLSMTAGMSFDEIRAGIAYAGFTEASIQNGYEYAKHLEAHGWTDINASDVNFLDDATDMAIVALNESVERWAKDNPINLCITSADRVAWNGLSGHIIIKQDLFRRYQQVVFWNDTIREKYGEHSGMIANIEDVKKLPYYKA